MRSRSAPSKSRTLDDISPQQEQAWKTRRRHDPQIKAAPQVGEKTGKHAENQLGATRGGQSKRAVSHAHGGSCPTPSRVEETNDSMRTCWWQKSTFSQSSLIARRRFPWHRFDDPTQTKNFHISLHSTRWFACGQDCPKTEVLVRTAV